MTGLAWQQWCGMLRAAEAGDDPVTLHFADRAARHVLGIDVRAGHDAPAENVHRYRGSAEQLCVELIAAYDMLIRKAQP